MSPFKRGDVLYCTPPMRHSSCQPLRGGVAIFTGRMHSYLELYVDWLFVPDNSFDLNEYRLPADHWEKIGHVELPEDADDTV